MLSIIFTDELEINWISKIISVNESIYKSIYKYFQTIRMKQFCEISNFFIKQLENTLKQALKNFKLNFNKKMVW